MTVLVEIGFPKKKKIVKIATFVNLGIFTIWKLWRKCGERKARFWKFKSFLSFRFYVKSILQNLDVTKMPFFCNFRGSEFGQFGKFQRSKSAKIHEILNSERVNVLQTLISRNIWVAEKRYDFHTVYIKFFWDIFTFFFLINGNRNVVQHLYNSNGGTLQNIALSVTFLRH